MSSAQNNFFPKQRCVIAEKFNSKRQTKPYKLVTDQKLRRRSRYFNKLSTIL